MRRKLTPEEVRLWQAQMKGVKRLSKEEKPVETIAKTAVSKTQAPQVSLPPKVASQEYKMRDVPNSFARQDLRRLHVEGQLDLHGMNLHDAYVCLIDFIAQSQRRGLKVVLIITGKGSISSEQTIRRQLPQWVREEPLSRMVSSFHYPVKIKDGGAGAFYLRLRRGKV